MSSYPRFLALATPSALTLCLLWQPLYAQQTSPQTEITPSNTADRVELSPFEVRSDRDSGYVATNTLAGSRMNASLADTPASISVLTKDFLNDIGALNVNQAMEYALSGGNDIGGGGSNVAATTGNGLIGNDFNFQIRGYRGATQTRDYFTTLFTTDAFNLDRIDIARGPNSILFGIGSPGGVVNVTPKRARLDADVTDVMLLAGSYQLRRGSFDVNRVLMADKLALRGNFMFQEADGFRDFEADDQIRGALAATYKPWAQTTIRFGGERGELKQNKVRPWMPYDGIAQWRAFGSHFVPFGTPQAPSVLGDENYSQFQSGSGNGLPALPPHPLYGGQVRTAGHTIQGSRVLLMDGPLAGNVVYTGSSAEFTRYYRTSSGSNVAGYNSPIDFEDESVFPRRGNITGPGQKVLTDYSTAGVTVEQRVGRNLVLEAAVNRADLNRRNQEVVGFAGITIMYDVTTTLPTFTSDGRYDATLGGPQGAAFASKLGIPYVPTTQGRHALNLNNPVANPNAGNILVYSEPRYTDTDIRRDDARFTGTYTANWGRAGKHNFLGMVSRAETETDSQSYREGNVHPDRLTANHFTDAPKRIYHIDPFSDELAERGMPDPFKQPIGPQTVLGLPSDVYQSGFVRDSWSHSRNQIDSAALAAQSTFFRDHLVTTVGGRRDRIRIWNHTRVVNSTTGEVTGLTAPTAEAIDQSGNTFTLGAVLHVPRVSWLSVFGNTSTNFRDQGGSQYLEDEAIRTQSEIGPLEGRGRDFGVKLNFWDNKFNATLTRFEVDLDNQASGHQSDVFNYINAIWTTIRNGGPNTVVIDQNDPNGHRVGGTDTRSQTSEGYELELTANPTPAWRVTFNVSKSENKISKLGGSLSAYMEKHRAEWQQYSNLNYDTLRAPGVLSNTGGTNTIGALVTGLDRWLAFVRSQEGQIETNIRPWNANLFTAYRFYNGPLKGLTLGGGVNYRGDSILGVRPGTLDDPSIQVFKGGDYFMFNALAGYDFKLKNDIAVRLQVNVDNLFDNQDKQVLASAWIPAIERLQTYRYYLNPRTIRVSAQFSF